MIVRVRHSAGARVRPPAFDAIEHVRLGEAVYQRIAEALVRGELRPGDRLKIRDIAEEMGTSVTPVRDAILRLVQDGALVQRSPRDIRVPVLEREEYLEIRRIRLELEGLAAEDAARKATLDDIGRLAAILTDNERAFAEGCLDEAVALNQVFHFALAEIAGLGQLRAILHRLWLKMGPVISAAYERGGRTMIDHHHAVLDAVRRADPAGARAAIQQDIACGGDVILGTDVLAPPSDD